MGGFYEKRMRAGDASLVEGRNFSLGIGVGALRLFGVFGYTDGTAAYIQVFEAPDIRNVAGGSTPVITIKVGVAGNFAFTPPEGMDMESCCAGASSTPDTYTKVSGNHQSLQGIFSPL